MKKLWAMGKPRLVLSLFAAISFIAACQGGPPQISIEGAKAQLSSVIVGEATATMTIRNQGGSDVLTAIKTDIPDAKASFHIMQGERMVSTGSVKIPSKSNIELKMGGSHIMIDDMPKIMKEGSKFNLILVFRKSGEKKIPLILQAAPAMPMGQ